MYLLSIRFTCVRPYPGDNFPTDIITLYDFITVIIAITTPTMYNMIRLIPVTINMTLRIQEPMVLTIFIVISVLPYLKCCKGNNCQEKPYDPESHNHRFLSPSLELIMVMQGSHPEYTFAP